MSQKKRIAKHRGHLFYNYSCIGEYISPTSLQFKSPGNTAAGKKLARKFGYNFLNSILMSLIIELEPMKKEMKLSYNIF